MTDRNTTAMSPRMSDEAAEILGDFDARLSAVAGDGRDLLACAIRACLPLLPALALKFTNYAKGEGAEIDAQMASLAVDTMAGMVMPTLGEAVDAMEALVAAAERGDTLNTLH